MIINSIDIEHAILHIADTDLDKPYLSSAEIDKDAEVWGFLEKHLMKVLTNDSLKNATFSDDLHKANLLVRSVTADNLKSISTELMEILFKFMKRFNLAASDIIFCLVRINKQNCHLAIMKFTYKETFTHDFATPQIRLLKQKATLPSESQKLDECIIVDLETFELKILEKMVEIDGGKDFYLSNKFFKCSNDLSTREKMSVLYKSVGKVSSTREQDFRRNALLQKTIAESTEETGQIVIQKVASQVFQNEPVMQADFIREVKSAGIVEDAIAVPEESSTVKKVKRNKIKTDTGIEIHFPSHYFNDKNVIDFVYNPDGTVSILIKNVNKIM